MTGAALAIVLMAGGPAAAADQARVAAINARLLAASSATDVLEAWCREHGVGDGRVVAERVPGPDAPLGAAERERLGVGAGEPLGYRHVRLGCGGVVLSEAENWFVPARLTPEMRRLLAETDTPFGAAIRPLGPRRENRLVHEPGGSALFVHEGLVRARDGRALALVRERYQPALAR